MQLDLRTELGLRDTCFETCTRYDFAKMEESVHAGLGDHEQAMYAGMTPSAIDTLGDVAEHRDTAVRQVAEAAMRNCFHGSRTAPNPLAPLDGGCGMIDEIAAMFKTSPRLFEPVIIRTKRPTNQ